MNDCAKMSYPTPAAAKRAAVAIAAKYRRQGHLRVPRGIHPCAECHAWHITSHRTNAKFRAAAG